MIRLSQSSFVMSSPSKELCPAADRAEFVVIGRSNVGKSTLINSLVDKKDFAKTSSKPGKTKLINYFDLRLIDTDRETIRKCYLVDLPGYGFARATKTKRYGRATMIEQYLLERKSITHIFVLLDSRYPEQDNDHGFVDWLAENNRPFSLIFTKSDLVNQEECTKNIDMFLGLLHPSIDPLPQVIVTGKDSPFSLQKIRTMLYKKSKK